MRWPLAVAGDTVPEVMRSCSTRSEVRIGLEETAAKTGGELDHRG